MSNDTEQFYQQLEALTSLDRWEAIQQLDGLSKVFSEQQKDALIAENKALRFVLRNGALSPCYSGVTTEGKEFGFPSVDDITPTEFEYLKERASSTHNPLLLARYSHILYEKEKHREYAEKAIDSYKKIIQLNIKDGEDENLCSSVEAILKLTEKVKLNVDQTKEELRQLVFDDRISVYDRFYISKSLVESPLYKSHEFKFLPELSLNWINTLERSNYFFIKEVLLTIIKICVNNKISTVLFYNKLAENEDLIIHEHPDDKDFIKHNAFAEKMEYYKKAKNKEMFDEAAKEYTRLKSCIELTLVEAKLSPEKADILVKEINRHIEEILSWDIESILSYFSNDTYIFPDIETVVSSISQNTENAFLRFGTTSVFDVNVNTKQLTDDEYTENEIYRDYLLRFQMRTMPRFKGVLQNGVINGKITYHHVYQYLQERSWYGQSFQKMKIRTHRNESSTYNWLDFLAPAIYDFISQIEASVLTGGDPRFSNWVLATDSLTLKFEGALRDFIRLQGFPTSILKKDEIKEMLLEDLLCTDLVKEKFTENDIALFKLVLTNKGENIRNNIAHCFYKADDYSFDKISKVFFCILRLGKYKLTPIAQS